MNTVDPGVAAVLRELRERSGLTVEQAADGIPCGPAWLARVEAGTAAPSLALIHAASTLYARTIHRSRVVAQVIITAGHLRAVLAAAGGFLALDEHGLVHLGNAVVRPLEQPVVTVDAEAVRQWLRDADDDMDVAAAALSQQVQLDLANR